MGKKTRDKTGQMTCQGVRAREGARSEWESERQEGQGQVNRGWRPMCATESMEGMVERVSGKKGREGKGELHILCRGQLVCFIFITLSIESNV